MPPNVAVALVVFGFALLVAWLCDGETVIGPVKLPKIATRGKRRVAALLGLGFIATSVALSLPLHLPGASSSRGQGGPAGVGGDGRVPPPPELHPPTSPPTGSIGGGLRTPEYAKPAGGRSQLSGVEFGDAGSWLQVDPTEDLDFYRGLIANCEQLAKLLGRDGVGRFETFHWQRGSAYQTEVASREYLARLQAAGYRKYEAGGTAIWHNEARTVAGMLIGPTGNSNMAVWQGCGLR
jgi:hypothetical protein